MPQENTLTEAEKREARERLKEKFGARTRTGGKGTERRKKKVVKTAKQEDKKVMSAVKKYSPQPLDGITEVNMFKDDNTVMHFAKPSVQFAVKESFVIITGIPETKELKELLPSIISQAGPQQYEYLKRLQEDMKASAPEGAAGDKKKEEIPDLVETNFEEVSNKA
eukprot:TRINITY_DN1552_c0_g1_i9.p2 TRINITY_DN1552_c0_g1~~TRINITY_DN1552_c0_g1_i9.p2  ORF type:complete len:166 (-),score=66.67 TRINITY_DN1552_c0_g1_i9:167-664(-)